MQIPTWLQFAWSAFIYRELGEDDIYQQIISRSDFLNNLRNNPSQLSIDEIQKYLIKGFLNPWKCHIHNNPASTIKSKLQSSLPYLERLFTYKIKDIDFNQTVMLDSTELSLGDIVQHYYDQIKNMGYNFGPTATSKLLHILQPQLFVMSDKDIFKYYKTQNPDTYDNSGQEYLSFLRIMKQIAVEVSENFNNQNNLNPRRQADQDIETYLSIQLNYVPRKTLAKYIDEYNWITITNGVTVPPAWHP